MLCLGAWGKRFCPLEVGASLVLLKAAEENQLSPPQSENQKAASPLGFVCLVVWFIQNYVEALTASSQTTLGMLSP